MKNRKEIIKEIKIRTAHLNVVCVPGCCKKAIRVYDGDTYMTSITLEIMQEFPLTLHAIGLDNKNHIYALYYINEVSK